MNALADRREFLRQTSAASLACLGASYRRRSPGPPRQPTASGFARDGAGRHHAAGVPGAGLRGLSEPLGHGGP